MPHVLPPIDPKFHSYDTGEPFDRCIMCNQYLLNEGTFYIIEKATRRYPALDTESIVFEYAMCMDCLHKMRSELSEESKSNIENYFRENVSFQSRYDDLSSREKLDINDWLSECIVKRTRMEDETEYVICAQCEGNGMIYGYFPYMVGGAAMDEVSELLSKKTRDVMDDFIDKHLGGPPELKELFKSNKKLLLV